MLFLIVGHLVHLAFNICGGVSLVLDISESLGRYITKMQFGYLRKSCLQKIVRMEMKIDALSKGDEDEKTWEK